MRLVPLARRRLEHVQEIAREAQAFGRRHHRLAAPLACGVGGQRRRLRDDPADLPPPHVGVIDLVRLGVERAERAEGRDERAHRVRVLGEAVEQRLDARGRHAVVVDGRLPGIELGLRRQLPVEQQQRDLEERALLRELLDRIAAIPQDARIAVDVADPAPTGRRVDQRRVVRHQAEVRGVDADLVDIGGADRLVLDRQLVGAAGAVVGEGQRVSHAEASSRITNPSRTGSSGSAGSGPTGSLGIRYSPSTHRARSASLHRSLQKGCHEGSACARRQCAHTTPVTGGIPPFYLGPAGGGKCAAVLRATVLRAAVRSRSLQHCRTQHLQAAACSRSVLSVCCRSGSGA